MPLASATVRCVVDWLGSADRRGARAAPAPPIVAGGTVAFGGGLRDRRPPRGGEGVGQQRRGRARR